MRDHLAHEGRQRLPGEIRGRHPTGVLWGLCGYWDFRNVHNKLKRKVREDMADDTRAAPPARALQSRRNRQCHQLVEIMRPFGRRYFGHTAEQTLWRASTHKHAAVGAESDQ